MSADLREAALASRIVIKVFRDIAKGRERWHVLIKCDKVFKQSALEPLNRSDEAYGTAESCQRYEKK
ncbi:MAG: hypothetical protein JO100_12045 [Pseudonocardia sp.]|nr:hypothetical protein [Pseudonocardia sp.]